MFQTIVVTQNRLIPSAFAFMFYFGGELLMVYYERIFKTMKFLQNSDEMGRGRPLQDNTFKRIIHLIKTCSILNEASRFYMMGMKSLLMVNCCFVFVNTFINIFYIVHRLEDGWDGCFDIAGLHIANMIETSGRFFLLCHTSDRIKLAVRISYYKKENKIKTIL